jgi:hypothetical protein
MRNCIRVGALVPPCLKRGMCVCVYIYSGGEKRWAVKNYIGEKTKALQSVN